MVQARWEIPIEIYIIYIFIYKNTLKLYIFYASKKFHHIFDFQ